MSRKNIAVLLLSFFLLMTCGLNNQGIIRLFNERAGQIENTFAPDLSLNVFSVSLENDNGSWILKGETTVPEARNQIIMLADSLLGQKAYSNAFYLLPDDVLGDSTYGIINVSVANLRRQPRHAAELVDQTVMGNTIRLLKRQKGWFLIQTEYGYIGWMTGGSFEKTDQSAKQKWEMSEKGRIVKIHSRAFADMDQESLPVSDLVLNAEIKILKRAGKWYNIQLPDGTEGFVRTDDIDLVRPNGKNMQQRIPDIIVSAKSMLGVPYLWGGNSSKANDCSGFTQTVFRANGIQLPRDARQQVHMGREIKPDEDFSNVQSGDLFFFGIGDRITHVGLGLGGAEFIHQSNTVHINSLNPEDPHFNAFRTRTLKTIKRIF